MSNTIQTQDGAEVYANRIEELVDEYAATLPADPETKRETLYNKSVFRGLLKYIYIHLFKSNEALMSKTNYKPNCNIDYEDIDLLDQIWDIYAGLCYRYGHDPSLLNFSVMMGTRNETFSRWMSDSDTQRRGGASSRHGQIVKRWKRESEAGTRDKALDGNPGAIFVLKAKYNYTETPQQLQIIGADQARLSTDEIAERYIDAKEEPRKPEDI